MNKLNLKSRRAVLKSFGTGIASFLFFGCNAQFLYKEEKPNVIIIFTDDQGYSDLSIHDIAKDVETPNIDRLAKDGVLFKNGYVTAPQCVPSRAGLITGKYQTRFGLEMNPQAPLSLQEKTIADRMKSAGYKTGMVGKWHLGILRKTKFNSISELYSPPYRGFDEYWCGAINEYRANIDLNGNLLNEPKTLTDKRYRIDVQTEAALSFLNRRSKDKQPFFLYLAYFAPHVPLQKPQKYMKIFRNVQNKTRQMGLASISAIDDGVGRIRKYLKDNALENTAIFFISDNGAPLRPAAWNGSLNKPLTGEKGMLTDGGIRVPFIMTWPSKISSGEIYDKPVISMDAAATALAIAGLSVPCELDGVNLLPFINRKNTETPHRTLYWRWRSQAAVLEDNWKLIYFAPDKWMLFSDTANTPEDKDVSDEFQDVVKKLRSKLEAFAAKQNPPGLPKKLHPQDRRFYKKYFEGN